MSIAALAGWNCAWTGWRETLEAGRRLRGLEDDVHEVKQKLGEPNKIRQDYEDLVAKLAQFEDQVERVMNEAQETFGRLHAIDNVIAEQTERHMVNVIEQVTKHAEEIRAINVNVQVLEDSLGVDGDRNPDGSVVGVGNAFQKINFYHGEVQNFAKELLALKNQVMIQSSQVPSGVGGDKDGCPMQGASRDSRVNGLSDRMLALENSLLEMRMRGPPGLPPHGHKTSQPDDCSGHCVHVDQLLLRMKAVEDQLRPIDERLSNLVRKVYSGGADPWSQYKSRWTDNTVVD